MAANMSGLPSFDDVNWEAQDADDELAIVKLLEADRGGDENAFQFSMDRPEDEGEKADDAEDFEDISDNELPDEEEPSHGHGDLPALTDDAGTSNDTDDLFGEGRDSSPFGGLDNYNLFNNSTLPSQDQPEEDLRAINFPENYGSANQDPNIPAPAESTEELVKQIWPGFEHGTVLNWNDLLPPKKAYYVPKVPAKPPKPLIPAKVSLDLAQDQEKSFYSAGSAYTDKRKRVSEAPTKGLVAIIEESDDAESDEVDFDLTSPSQLEPIGGFTFADLEIICDDWESKINPPAQTYVVPEDEPMDEWEKEILGHSSKRRKVEHREIDVFDIPRFAVPSFDDFEEATQKIAKRVVLDLNDPYLLVDVSAPDSTAKRRRIGIDGSYKRAGNGGLSSGLSKRFNISNDEAYDALKENHQSKVRATIGNLSVEHSMPALKLQWPYYRVKLYTKDARSFHRPSLKFNRFLGQSITFSKPGTRKKKTFKSMSTQDVFAESRDLSLMDHYSSATLLEYSEEHPTVLSNFGMGNRIINYYRRKTHDDPERPQPEDKVGDTTILLPEDKSPFSNFGMVDPGETVRTIHNAMYRAPIFKHEPKSTDFLIIRGSTGIGGTTWHIRNIDNLFVVGQQFPSMEIPGPHSRKVTNAAKNRMKMIAYRKIRHSEHNHLKIQEITAHIADSTDMQNRQKLKEFIHYDKTEKVWKMQDNEAIPEEHAIRSMVKPEEVCVIDAMQVGARHLEDAGYAVDDDDEDDTGDRKKDGDKTTNPEQELAPWKTSKAFLDASADKAMLQLHGEGDPSGRGLAFSFIKTSMKGGYIGALRGPAASSAAAMAAEKKANGGHSYNVKMQQIVYNNSIRDIWEKQKANLSDTAEHPENEMELELENEEEEEKRNIADQTPRAYRVDALDDSVSQQSAGSRQGSARVMRIIRTYKSKFNTVEEKSELVKDPRVWREYQKRRAALDAEAVEYERSALLDSPSLTNH
jgi:transcription initiation factor TFIID subunit 1